MKIFKKLLKKLFCKHEVGVIEYQPAVVRVETCKHCKKVLKKELEVD